MCMVILNYKVVVNVIWNIQVLKSQIIYIEELMQDHKKWSDSL